jgi:peptide deformylase
MPLKIIPMDEALLVQQCDAIPVEQISSPEVQHNIQQMKAIYQSIPAVGLAAPQVGWNARVFLIGIEDAHSREDQQGLPLTVYINPTYEVVDTSSQVDWEGCFSIYHQCECGLLGQVPRYKAIRFTAYNEAGEPFSETYQDFRARVFQHECDHLDGVRYPNRMRNGNLLELSCPSAQHKIHLHQLPKVLNKGLIPELAPLAPVLLNAPTCGVSKQLKQQIALAYDHFMQQKSRK